MSTAKDVESPAWRVALKAFAQTCGRIETVPLPTMERVTNEGSGINYVAIPVERRNSDGAGGNSP